MPSPAPLKVLVVEDDPGQAEVLRRWLKRMREPDFEPVLASSVDAGLKALDADRFDAVLLDRVLGDGDGLTVLAAIRRDARMSDLPVFLMSGSRNMERDVAAGLTRGADEYLTKPLSLEILSARLIAVLRRCRRIASDEELLGGPGFQLEVSSGRLLIDDRVEHLEPKEAALLAVLLRRPNMVHSADALREMVWGESAQPRNTLESRLHTLRRKLGDRASCIENIRGRGYRLLA